MGGLPEATLSPLPPLPSQGEGETLPARFPFSPYGGGRARDGGCPKGQGERLLWERGQGGAGNKKVAFQRDLPLKVGGTGDKVWYTGRHNKVMKDIPQKTRKELCDLLFVPNSQTHP